MTTLITSAGTPSRSPAAESPEKNVTDDWRPIYRAAGIAALAVVALMPVQMAVFVLWPPPTTIADWFALFQRNSLVGLMNMDLALIVDYVLLAVLFLGLFAALRRVRPALAAAFLMLELLAAAVYFASAVAFEMLAASGQWAAAGSDLERAAALAVGQGLLLTWQGTAFTVSYVLAGTAMLLVGVVMLRGGPFGKITAYAGIAGGALGLIPASAGMVGLVASLLSLIPLAVWLVGTGRGLLRVASRGGA
ncbi:MAG TPA: hypothetical protein VL333_00220 [Candidatus Saccharimonadales bacterium]|nr:hypothetical protein [Candidatus Saccharimonadales bacterium]